MLITIRDENGQPKSNVDAVVRPDFGIEQAGRFNGVQYEWVFDPKVDMTGASFRATSDGYDTYTQRFVLTSKNPQITFDDGQQEVHMVPVAPVNPDVDPTQFSLEVLAKIWGAMWTKRLNLPFGHRSGQDSNINAFCYYEIFSDEDRQRMCDDYRSVGYTHCVLGPVTGNDRYHGEYPGWTGIPTQEVWDAYLDKVQELWNRGITPIYFAHPDGWELPRDSALMDQLDVFYRQERAQRLLRVVVYPGWEPSGDKYGWANSQWVAWLQRGAQVFPNALRGVHFPMDLDAPTGQNDDQTFPKGQGNIISWQNAAPYIHFFLDQVGGYVQSNNPIPSENFKSELTKHIQRHVKGFTTGYGGWPTFSAWGQNRGITYILAEYAAYGDYWHNWPEQYALDLGDLAIQAGAQGYLDGGRTRVV